MKNIITVTINPTIDINSSTESVTPNKKLRCETPNYEPGGGGINVSRAIKKLEGTSTALYTSGGAYGNMLKSLLDDEGVQSQPYIINDITRGNFMIYEKSSGEQFRFAMPGPEINSDEYNGFIEKIKQTSPKPDFIVGSGSIPPSVPDDFYATLGSIAKELDAKFILDTSGDSLRCTLEKESAYLIKPNMREFQEITEEDINDENQQEKAAKNLIEKGICEVFVLSLGAGGVLFVTKDKVKRLRAPSVRIKSRVGAGDSMAAGIVLSLASGKSVDEAILYGIASGSAAVITPGNELCRKDDTEMLYKRLLNEHLR
jgi:6-phosphofructokinase 2